LRAVAGLPRSSQKEACATQTAARVDTTGHEHAFNGQEGAEGQHVKVARVDVLSFHGPSVRERKEFMPSATRENGKTKQRLRLWLVV
jgi:hypothetical protein